MAEDHATAADAQDTVRRLQAAFAKVHAERMQDVPILNTALVVEVVGARAVEHGWLCALVTPWSINLMLLPKSADDDAAWRVLGLGTTRTHVFPAGHFAFIVGEEAGFGVYQMCSLFSPVFEFASHEAAVLTAGAALDALFDAALASGDGEKQTPPIESPSNASAPAETGNHAGVTRRGLLLGRAGQPRIQEI